MYHLATKHCEKNEPLKLHGLRLSESKMQVAHYATSGTVC